MPCSIGTFAALAAGTRTNSTVNLGVTPDDGDILVYGMTIGGASGGVTATGPTGFTVATGLPVSYTWTSVDTYAVRLYFWTKKAASESGSTYTATHSSADTTAVMWRIPGGDQTTWVDQNPTSVVTNGVANGNTCPVPTQTPTVDGCALLWFGGSWDGWGAQSPSSGFTERRNVSTEAFYAQDLIQATAAATGTVTVPIGQAADRPKGGVMLTIRAAVGGGGVDPEGSLIHGKLIRGGLLIGGVL
jgi:hypothetical protein